MDYKHSSLRITKKIKEDIGVHPSFLETLYVDRGTDVSRDVVFLQVSHPGKHFLKYSEEKQKLCLTLAAYMEVLKFFRVEFPKLTKKMETDLKNMNNKSDWVQLSPFLSFRGTADISIKQVIESNSKFCLDLTLYREYDFGNQSAYLRYSDEKLGSIGLPINGMKLLCRDLPTLSDLLDYKENGLTKRQRQS